MTHSSFIDFSHIEHLTDQEVQTLIHDWSLWARPSQLPPDNPASANYRHPSTHPNLDYNTLNWEIWLALAGRGWGKTRSGAQQVLRWIQQGYSRIAIIAPTTADTRDVVTEGESGILTIAPPNLRPTYEPSKRRLTFPNGAIATLYSAEEPERLRGPQHMAIWMDEMAAWSDPQATWDQAMFGLRLGRLPQVFISTTPKPIPLIRSLILRSQQQPNKVVVTTGSTYENADNLASTFFQAVAQYEGTRLGRQELHAELIDPSETGIIQKSWLRLFPRSLPLPKFEHIIQSYDTAFTEKTMDSKTKDPDPSACITLGVYRDSAPPYNYKVLILDCWTDHLSYPDLRARSLKEYSYEYGPTSDPRKPDVILIEDKGSGISLRQDLQRAGLPVRPYNPGRADKVQRLHAVSHIPCRGLVYIPESTKHPGQFTSWAAPMIDQITTFPLTTHDDLVDAFSQALLYLSDSGWLTIDEPVEEDNEIDYNTKRSNPYSE